MKDAYDDADAASIYFTVNDAALHAYRLGEPGNPPLVMLHGMQDLSRSLLPVARKLSERFCVWLPDLRGHGRSARPGIYSMSAFVYDLYALICAEVKTPVALFGHSLGGQICARMAALFPELVTSAVIVEGLGPSTAAMAARARTNTDLAHEAARLKGVYGHRSRPLTDLTSAARKLATNNPRLGITRAQAIAAIATEPAPDGTLTWAFDPLVRAVFIGTDDAPRYWPHVQCPVLLVAGSQAHEYWTRATGLACADGGDFAPGELRARQQTFSNAELVEFEGSGHMVHFDQPEQLADVSFEYLSRINAAGTATLK